MIGVDHTRLVHVELGMILGTKCPTWLATTPEVNNGMWDVFDVPTEARLLVLEEVKTWVKVLVMGSNKTGWLEKNADDFAFYVYCAAPK